MRNKLSQTTSKKRISLALLRLMQLSHLLGHLLDSQGISQELGWFIRVLH